MEMNEQDSIVHRTWVQLLLDSGQKEAAAIAVDTEVAIIEDEYKRGIGDRVSVQLHIPTSVYGYVKSNEHIRAIFEETISELLLRRPLVFGRYDNDGRWYESKVRAEQLNIAYYVQFIPIEQGWKDMIKTLISGSTGVSNQGAVTEFMFAKAKKEPILYSGLKFASQSEVRIAQEFVQRKILFFPLVVGLRVDTGQLYQDWKELDFLVCHNASWGVLEVSGPSHDGIQRYAKDAEKDGWLKQSGVLCIEHRTAEQCYNFPKKVVDDFLNILSKHKR